MTSMIERVSRALCKVNAEDPDEWLRTDMGRRRWQGKRRAEAIVAITAMREPSSDMIRAALFTGFDKSRTQPYNDAWQAMIDEALRDRP